MKKFNFLQKIIINFISKEQKLSKLCIKKTINFCKLSWIILHLVTSYLIFSMNK